MQQHGQLFILQPLMLLYNYRLRFPFKQRLPPHAALDGCISAAVSAHEDNRAITLNVRDACFLWKRCLFMGLRGCRAAGKQLFALWGRFSFSFAPHYFSLSGRLAFINISDTRWNPCHFIFCHISLCLNTINAPIYVNVLTTGCYS